MNVTRDRFDINEPISFTERGIEFFVFANGDFDFNVVIRSIMYNENNKYIGYQVGSAITFYSDAEDEFDECLLKAKAIEKVLMA